MSDDYLVVAKRILPDYLIKVMEAQELLDQKKVANITEAAKAVGISRTTFYKYKDCVFNPVDPLKGRRAVINMVLKNIPGILSKVISTVSSSNANIITISQSVPVSGKADVMMSLDISEMTCGINDLVVSLRLIPETISANLETVG